MSEKDMTFESDGLFFKYIATSGDTSGDTRGGGGGVWTWDVMAMVAMDVIAVVATVAFVGRRLRRPGRRYARRPDDRCDDGGSCRDSSDDDDL